MTFKIGDKIKFSGEGMVSGDMMGNPVVNLSNGQAIAVDPNLFPSVEIIEPEVSFSQKQISAILKVADDWKSDVGPYQPLAEWLDEHKETKV